MKTVRPPAVAGHFYPSDQSRLRTDIGTYLAAAGGPADPVQPRALIVPHAGYIYSGPVAAVAYARLTPFAEKLKHIILIGPSHFVQFKGIAAPGCDGFETPLGPVPLDTVTIGELARLSLVRINDQAHAREHSLEVQLPFLQSVLKEFSLLPLLVGTTCATEVEEVLKALWDRPETLLIISTDLSHYHNYRDAVKLDGVTAEAIENIKPQSLQREQACGYDALSGLLRLAGNENLKIERLALKNSGDTAGDKSSVVGYGAWVVY